MTLDRLRECLDALNWRTAQLAAMTHVSPVTARRWQSGKRPVPAQVGAAIEAMADAVVRLSGKTSDQTQQPAPRPGFYRQRPPHAQDPAESVG